MNVISVYECHYYTRMSLSCTNVIIMYESHYHIQMSLSCTKAIIIYECHYYARYAVIIWLVGFTTTYTISVYLY